jgi:hypothetical protein
MDEKIEKFLEEVALGADTETYNAMVSDAQNMGTGEFVAKYMPVIQKDPSLSLAAKQLGIDKFTKSKWERYQDTFGSSDKDNPFEKDESWLKAVHQEDFSDIDYKTFKNDIDKMSKYWQEEMDNREEYKARKDREREVKEDWGTLKKFLANEYSQARYIDDPNSTPFGEQGTFDPWENKLELANIGLQGTSLVGDAIPGGWGYVAGPGVRLVNDLVQEAGDYGKPAKDILADRALDLGTSFVGEAGPNTLLRGIGRSEKLGKKLSQGVRETMDYADLMKEVKETNRLAELWKKEPSYARRQKILEQMPDNYVKSELTKFDAPGLTVDHLQKMGVPQLKLIPQEEAAVKANLDEVLAEGVEGGKYGKDYTWNKRVGTTPEPGQFGKAVAKTLISPAAEGAGVLIGRDLSKAGTKSIYDKRPMSDKDRKLIDWYKKEYNRDWSMDNAFKPKEEDGLLYQAWKEWDEERRKEK